MNEYKCILFDLDGTLVNTFPGILHSYEYAASKMNLPAPTEKIVNEAIGAPLAEVFREKFQLDEEQTTVAMQYYRERYAEKGIYEVENYPKMTEVLKQLKEKGLFVGVATLKKEEFAKEMLKNLGMSEYLDVIVGMDGRDKLTKSGMIQKAMKLMNQNQKETVLVGDSFYDAVGAEEAGVDFIGVTYGFGFKTIEDVRKYKNKGMVNVPIELLEVVS